MGDLICATVRYPSDPTLTIFQTMTYSLIDVTPAGGADEDELAAPPLPAGSSPTLGLMPNIIPPKNGSDVKEGSFP